MSDPIRGLVGAVAAVALCAACGASADPPGTTAKSESGGAENAVTVNIKDFRYDPATVRVAVGGTVTFTQLDESVHTATAKGEHPFDTGNLEKGAEKSVTFDQAGTISYICDIHQYMKGTVEVV